MEAVHSSTTRAADCCGLLGNRIQRRTGSTEESPSQETSWWWVRTERVLKDTLTRGTHIFSTRLSFDQISRSLGSPVQSTLRGSLPIETCHHPPRRAERLSVPNRDKLTSYFPVLCLLPSAPLTLAPFHHHLRSHLEE